MIIFFFLLWTSFEKIFTREISFVRKADKQFRIDSVIQLDGYSITVDVLQ